jgi:hypothetical protein
MTTVSMRTNAQQTRRDLIVDSLGAAALAVLLTVATYFASQNQPTRRSYDGWAIALLLVAGRGVGHETSLLGGHPGHDLP